MAAGEADGWDISLQCQPPNSPYFNILVLVPLLPPKVVLELQ